MGKNLLDQLGQACAMIKAQQSLDNEIRLNGVSTALSMAKDLQVFAGIQKLADVSGQKLQEAFLDDSTPMAFFVFDGVKIFQIASKKKQIVWEFD